MLAVWQLQQPFRSPTSEEDTMCFCGRPWHQWHLTIRIFRSGMDWSGLHIRTFCRFWTTPCNLAAYLFIYHLRPYFL